MGPLAHNGKCPPKTSCDGVQVICISSVNTLPSVPVCVNRFLKPLEGHKASEGRSQSRKQRENHVGVLLQL